MSLTRQGRHYLVIGGVQWLLDWGVMVALSHLGLRIGVANIAGRISGALIGFWLNGRITFAGDEHAIGRTQLLRFLVMWVAMTVLSTVAIEAIDDVLGRKWAWLAKPLVELVLGLIGFIGSRQWVYRK
ncbi:MAG: GtrA family protein [Pseudomonadota bacterium]|nr:GtrA family protein [Pseudomonadota bacterium]